MTPRTTAASADPSPSLKLSVVPATSRQFRARIDELIRVHLEAMNYPPHAHAQRRRLWLDNAQRPDFTCSLALAHPLNISPDADDRRQPCVGVGYAFRGSPDTWWYQQVSRGLAERGLTRMEVTQHLHAYAELSELHVLPGAQGHGVGGRILDDVLARAPQQRVMLSTPEVAGEANAAWALYRSRGFVDLLRNFRFPADPRPFGILVWQAPQ